MENPMRLIPLIFIPLIILISGCISGLDAESFAKASPIIQDFLRDHPNAEILATHFTANQSGMMLEEIREECANPYLEAKEYYRVRFTDPDTGFYAVVWIDWEARAVECAFKKGEGTEDVENCTSHAEYRCYGQHVYWFDSCGYKEVKKEYCEQGCREGRCINKETCEEIGGYCIYPTQTGTAAAGLITGKPTAITGCESYYSCPDGSKVRKCEEVKKFDDKGNFIGVGCACKENPEYLCLAEVPELIGIEPLYQVCDEGYYKTDNWCPDEGICCAPGTGCKSHAEYRCYGGHVYWFDSCGHVQEKKEYCQFGCELGFCKSGPSEFCGTSTEGTCQGDGDCATGGCSGQVCQSKAENPAGTTCEWRECYDAAKYSMECGCVEGECRWRHRCRSHHEYKCYENDLYWFNSCGYKEEKKQECPYGCEARACKTVSDCNVYLEGSGDKESITVFGKTYTFELKGYETGVQTVDKAYLYINGQQTSPYGWNEGSTYTIPGTRIDVLVRIVNITHIDPQTARAYVHLYVIDCNVDVSCDETDDIQLMGSGAKDSVTVFGKTYTFELKGYETGVQTVDKAYLYINGQQTSPYGWNEGSTYTIPETGVGFKVSKVEVIYIDPQTTVGLACLKVKECAEEGEEFSHVYTNEYPEHCCQGLTEWNRGMDTRISIAEDCYETGLLAGSPVGLCIECGNQVCEENEDACNCPADCANGQHSDYANVSQFCLEAPAGIVTACEQNLMNLTLCHLGCQW